MKFVPVRLSRAIGMQKLKLSANSPTILLVAGITGVVGSTVLAARATLQAQPILEATHMELEKVAYDVDKASRDHNIIVPESEIRKQRVVIYTQTAAQLTKLYAPAVVLGSISIGSLIYSHKILNDRYTNLAAAYVSLSEVLESYRKRVREDVGEDKERELWYDVQTQDEIVTGPNGPKKVKTKVVGENGASPYAVLFGPDNKNWKSTPEYNTMFLRQVEEYLNRRLRTEGYLFLNRAYEELGLPATEFGSTTGWLYERGNGDNYVDFGIWDETDKTRMYDFMVGNEKHILLDFNVDGPIHKLLNLPKVR